MLSMASQKLNSFGNHPKTHKILIDILFIVLCDVFPSLALKSARLQQQGVYIWVIDRTGLVNKGFIIWDKKPKNDH